MLAEAAAHFETAIARLTSRHPNPCTGEAHYFLGLVRRFQGLENEAYAAFYKSTWNYEWRAAAYYELAALDCKKGEFFQALEHCEASLDTNRQNNKAIILKALAMNKLGQDGNAVLTDLLNTDPLDHWARYVLGDMDGFFEKSRNDAQTVLDLVYDFADAGFVDEAVQLLELHHSHEVTEVAVPNPLEKSQLTYYAVAWLKNDFQALEQARALSPDYFFPSRLHDQLVLEWAAVQGSRRAVIDAESVPQASRLPDSNALYGLGNYYYDKKRHEDAISVWEQAAGSESLPYHATLHRNLGIAYWNVRRDGEAARNAYQKALVLDPNDARIFAEYDQLREKLGDAAADRLEALLARPGLVSERDDCSVALATLFNETDAPEKALDLLLNRRFHPWEGGEGKVLNQYKTARLKLGLQSLNSGDAETALKHFEQAMQPPENLGEAYHLLQAKADVSYWTAKALRALGRASEAVNLFESSANEAGDFQSMAVTEHSELSYYRGLSLIELRRMDDASTLFVEMERFAEREKQADATIDYFATSLPNLLVFEEDLNAAKNRAADRLLQLAEQGLGQVSKEGRVS
jgi:tetratricopeptide (TPR) repeat protein